MTTVQVLAIIGLVIGLVVLLVVIWLLQNTLNPLLAVKNDVVNAQTAPMLKNGVPGTEQLGTTRRLADGAADLAVRYMMKLGLPVNTETPGPAAAASQPAAAPQPTYAPQAAAAPSPPPAAAPASGAEWAPPAWHKHRR